MLVRKGRTDDLSLLWSEYKKVGSWELRNHLVEKYLWLASKVVDGVMSRPLARLISRDEIQAAGNFGLMQAIEGYDLERGIRFETYAPARIRGAILDWLREIDWIPRAVRSNAKLWRETVHVLQEGSGYKPTIEEVADYLRIPIENADGLQQDAEGAKTRFQQEGDGKRGEDFEPQGASELDQLPDSKGLLPFDEAATREEFEKLIECLTTKEQIIVTLYYRDNFTMKHISIVLGISESRISQMHGRALLKIKNFLA